MKWVSSFLSVLRNPWVVYLLCAVGVLTITYGMMGRNFLINSPERYYYGAMEDYPIDAIGNMAIMQDGYAGDMVYHAKVSSTWPVWSLLKEEYLTIGHIARLVHIPPVYTFLFVRFFVSLLYFFVVWQIICRLFPRRQDQLTATVLVFFGTGLAFGPGAATMSVLVLDVLPLSRMTVPAFHYLLGGLSGIVSVFFFARALDRRSFHKSFLAAMTSGIVASYLYAPTIVLFLLGIGSYFLVRTLGQSWQQKKLCIAWGDVGIFVAYSIWVCLPIVYVRFVVATLWSAFNATNKMEKLYSLHPGVGEYLIIVGIPYVLSLFSFRRVMASRSTFLKLLVGWVVIHPVFEFFLAEKMDLNAIRAFLTPYFLVFSFLGTIGLAQILSGIKRLSPRVSSFSWGIVLVTVVVGSMGAMKMNFDRYNLCYCSGRYFDYGYPKREVMDAVWWLRDHTTPSDNILTMYYAGSLVPAFASVQVYHSWWFYLSKPKNFEEVFFRAFMFLRGDLTEKEARDMVDREKITYVFWSEEEQNANLNIPKPPYSFLEEVYRSGNTAILKVKE